MRHESAFQNCPLNFDINFVQEFSQADFGFWLSEMLRHRTPVRTSTACKSVSSGPHRLDSLWQPNRGSPNMLSGHSLHVRPPKFGLQRHCPVTWRWGQPLFSVRSLTNTNDWIFSSSKGTNPPFYQKYVKTWQTKEGQSDSIQHSQIK